MVVVYQMLYIVTYNSPRTLRVQLTEDGASCLLRHVMNNVSVAGYAEHHEKMAPLYHPPTQTPNRQPPSPHHMTQSPTHSHVIQHDQGSDIHVSSTNGIRMRDRVIQPGHPAHVMYVADQLSNITQAIQELLRNDNRCQGEPDPDSGSPCPCVPPALSEYTRFTPILLLILPINHLRWD